MIIPPTAPKKKPSVHDSLLITFYKVGEVMNYIVNLDSIIVEYLEDERAKITLKNTKHQPTWPEEIQGVGVVVCDDPNLEHAGGWSNMGCTRILHMLRGAKSLSDAHFCYEGKLISKSVIIPERIPENETNQSDLHV